MITGTILILAGGIVVGGALPDSWAAYGKAIVGLFCVMAGTFLICAAT